MPLSIQENEVYTKILKELEDKDSVIITDYSLSDSTKRMLAFKGISMKQKNGEIIAKKNTNGIIGAIL